MAHTYKIPRLLLIFIILNLLNQDLNAQTTSHMGIYTNNPDFNINSLKFDLVPRAQNRNYSTREKIDISNLNITYMYTYVTRIDSLEKIRDLQILEIGNNVNRFYSLYGELADSVSYENYLYFLETKTEKGMIDFQLDKDERASYVDIFTYPKQNVRLVSERFKSSDYQYTEDIKKLDWSILPESDIILGYKCYKANVKFRGREWFVWFAYDIPYNYGPWKFGGLPGLILKAEEKDGLFSWLAIGIENSIKHHIYKHSANIKSGHNSDKHIVRKSSRQKNAKLLKTSWMYSFFMCMGDNRKVFVGGKEVDMRLLHSGRVYYPQLELE